MRIIFNKGVITHMRLMVVTPEPYSSVLYVMFRNISPYPYQGIFCVLCM